jgi:single-strand DNA-binding protein
VRCRRGSPTGPQGLGLRQPPHPGPRRSPQRLTLTGNGRLARDVELRSTHGGDSVATVRMASDRRDRQADPVYVDLILWRGQAEAAAAHLVKGQAVGFSGRFEPRA